MFKVELLGGDPRRRLVRDRRIAGGVRATEVQEYENEVAQREGESRAQGGLRRELAYDASIVANSALAVGELNAEPRATSGPVGTLGRRGL